MLTKNEITALNLSPTKKDFVQIWNELLDVAGRLSERWDPTSTNESDPGIVILKALTGIADKLNYNIDKNTLEAFMPTAAQEDSMRKLCDMLGYNVKYYRSAETTVNIKYYNSDPSDDEVYTLQSGLVIPKFTVISNSDQDINYFTTNTNPVYISTTTPSVTVSCMEGQIVKCESTTDNYVITANQISDSNRFYLPEYQIAENGIFVYNVVANSEDGDIWAKVDNLNIQARGSRVFKFGYDSYEGRPYLEFPDDYSELINDGLFIYYARTSGANGNVSARTLTQLELPNLDGWDKVSAESFSVENSFSATTGSNIETISQAYNNFKKTIGTFETLVTCRDYMNKIYTMIDDSTSKHLVSNALVTDIRTDINRAVTICSCDDAGIFYKESPLLDSVKVLDNAEYSSTKSEETIDKSEAVDERKLSTANKPVFNAKRNVSNSCWFLGSADGLPLSKTSFIDSVASTPGAFNAEQDGKVVEFEGFWWIEQGAFRFKTVLPVEEIISTTSTVTKTITNTITNHIESTVETSNAIDHFDLVLYPFKSYNQIRNNVKDIQAVYDKSFEYTPNVSTIKNKLEQSDIKTIAHNIVSPRKHDIVSINNYLRLNAIIGTTSKITTEEGVLLIEKIKIALANAFNMRELDFGEEIPFDSILSVIENADTRISVVSLAEPALYTTFSVFEGTDSSGNPILREYAVASDWLTETYADTSDRFEYTTSTDDTANKYTHTFNTTEAKKIYNRLAVRNVLAGRIPLFKYNTTFNTSFSDSAYRVTTNILDKPVGLAEPNESNAFTIYIENGITYTGQWSPEGIKYTKTYVPDDYVNNIITKDDEDDTNFTEIETKFEIQPDKDVEGNSTACISNVELLGGEFVKFRAPNFITDKTYPAYVNYHLKLNRPSTSEEKEASAADATTIYSLITDRTVGESWRNAIFTHFASSDSKKKFTLSQLVYGKDSGKVTSGDITITVDNTDNASITPDQILDKSGFIRLVSGKATLKSTDPSVKLNSKLTMPEIYLTYDKDSNKTSISTKKSSDDTKDILTANVFSAIKTVTDMCLVDIDESILPDKDWLVSYDFEYIPFELASLSEWENLIKNGSSLLGYVPITEYSTSLWRVYKGSYQIGKYVLIDGASRLMPFTGGHFGLLESNYLDSVYVVRDLGKDAIPDFIRNDEEYQLRAGEYLYIEYTPSSTTEDGTTQTQDPIKEVHKEGTIIKPSGFDGFGLLNATELEQSGKQATKTVAFSQQDGASGSVDIGMYSLGASEQISIRELSKVVLDGKSLPNPTIYVYKNFNDCKELEKPEYNDSGKRINNTYTLKDGEYILYTDNNKAELAYYTSGTELTLEGNFYIPKCELIDIATIFDSGIQDIPWVPKTFAKNDSIVFQEFQYITLGPNDTLQSLFLYDPYYGKLDATWQKCADAAYTVAGSDELVRLSNISLADDTGGNGWEACSILELNVSPNSTQTLRTTDKLETSITLYKTPASGIGEREEVITLKAVDKDHPLSFKTNISCLSSSGKLHIDDIYTNADNVRSFEFKILSECPPAIIRTKPDKLVPCADSNITDITAWVNDATKTFNTKSYGELWTRVPLAYLVKPEDLSEDTESYDNALKLPVCVLPNTYGVFSIYINYSVSNSNAGSQTDIAMPESWIYLLPGASEDDITLLNVNDNDIIWEKTSDYIRLKLRPQINCIRVNKTCDLFIKTSFRVASDDNSTLTSALYFDDLRLVDCQPIEYTENGETKLQKTQGLNLSQIGYLDTADTDPLSAFDMQIRKNLRKEYTEEAAVAIDERAKEELKNLTTAMSDLQADKPKLQQLVDFLAKAKAEITTLVNNADEQVISQLFTKYKELHNDLEQEKALQNALADNKNIVELEKQLADLLASFGGSESVKHEMLKALDDLELAATDKASTFTNEYLSKGTILDDFEAVADSTDKVLISDLKLFSIKEVNSEYTTKLAELASAVEEVDNTEAKDTLVAILDDLNITKHSKLIVQIQNLVKEHQEALLALLNEVQTLAVGELNTENNTYEVNYAELRATLVNLREYISVANINDILSELSSITDSNMDNSDKYSELIRVTNELSSLLSTDNPAESGTYASLLTATDRLLAMVQTKINDNAVSHDSTVTSTVDALYTTANGIYIAQLNSLLSELKATLSDLEDNYSEAIESLKEYENDIVQSILSTLDNYKTARLAQIEAIESFGDSSITDAYLSLPYGTLAVLAVWPVYMKRVYTVCIAKLYRDIRLAINSQSVSGDLILDTGFYTNSAHTVLRQALVTAANLTAFQQLYNQVKTQVEAVTQNAKRVELINSLGTLVAPSSALYDALNAIKLDSDTYADRNAVLKQLINDWQNSNTVVEKQLITSNLIAELEAVIQIDTKLVEISAKLLCPSILLFPVCDIQDVEKDDFYDTLYNHIYSQKNALLNTISGFTTKLTGEKGILSYLESAYIADNDLLLAIDSGELSKFSELSNLEASDASTMLLTEEFINKVIAARNILEVQEQLLKIKSSKLLKLMQSNIVTAWQTSDGTWLDSTGNECTPAYLSSVTAKCTNDGIWRSANNELITVRIDSDGDSLEDGWLLDTSDYIADKDLDSSLNAILEKLLKNVSELSQLNYMSEEAKAAHNILWLETQLLNEIKELDRNKEFYYNVPVETNVAIDFNESDATLSTLMNPAVNYDINNVNNNFVISKIDINYLTTGLQIARSSKLS